VKILRLDPTERKIGLSIRAVTEAADVSAERYSSGSSAGGGGSISIGDFAQDLGRDKKSKRRKDKQDEGYEEDYED
jgi:predicted RNA-binding protein with RPS1 domain